MGICCKTEHSETVNTDWLQLKIKNKNTYKLSEKKEKSSYPRVITPSNSAVKSREKQKKNSCSFFFLIPYELYVGGLAGAGKQNTTIISLTAVVFQIALPLSFSTKENLLSVMFKWGLLWEDEKSWIRKTIHTQKKRKKMHRGSESLYAFLARLIGFVQSVPEGIISRPGIRIICFVRKWHGLRACSPNVLCYITTCKLNKQRGIHKAGLNKWFWAFVCHCGIDAYNLSIRHLLFQCFDVKMQRGKYKEFWGCRFKLCHVPDQIRNNSYSNFHKCLQHNLLHNKIGKTCNILIY